MKGHINYVAWGGGTRSIPAPFELGTAAPPPPRQYGPRRALWDAAYGYVNGFPALAIAYYVLTRSLHPRVWAWAFRREQRHGYQEADVHIDNHGQITYVHEE